MIFPMLVVMVYQILICELLLPFPVIRCLNRDEVTDYLLNRHGLLS